MGFFELGQKVKQLRTEQRVSQQLMAGHLDISRATLSAFENGRSGDIGIKKVMYVLDYLSCELRIKERSLFPTFEELLDANQQQKSAIAGKLTKIDA